MRPVHVARLDKSRPVLVLTRQPVLPYLKNVTVAPITTRIRGLSTEVPVGPDNGLERESVVSLDNVQTIPRSRLGRRLGWLATGQEAALAKAVTIAFDLESQGGEL